RLRGYAVAQRASSVPRSTNRYIAARGEPVDPRASGGSSFDKLRTSVCTKPLDAATLEPYDTARPVEPNRQAARGRTADRSAHENVSSAWTDRIVHEQVRIECGEIDREQFLRR